MTISEPPSYEAAIAHLCSDEWAPNGIHVATRYSDEILRALLPASRTDEGRAALGSTPRVIEHLVCVLRDPLIFHEQLGSLAIRLLRNLCARSVANQGRTAQCGAHDLVLDCINKRFDFCDGDGSGADATAVKRVEQLGDEDHHRMRLPFFGFAVEFLVNFVTCNADNAELVWRKAFPSILEKLLECDNPAAASATAALVHNCIAIEPDRMNDIVRIWSKIDNEGKSLAMSIVQQMKNVGDGDGENEHFSWSFMIIRRLIGASLLEGCFEALGPSLGSILQSAVVSFSEAQKTFLEIIDAAAGKSAERPAEEDIGSLVFPDSTLGFLAELIEAALFEKNANVLRTVGNIAASVIIITRESVELNDMRLRSVKVAVNVLHAITHAESGTTENGTAVDANPISVDSTSAVGLRAVMIRCVAICCDLSKEAQDSVRKLKGIPVVLNALSYERNVARNPFLREWAILAVRNLTLANPDNAMEISSYELAGIQQDTELLEKTGLEAYMDTGTGRPRLRVRSDRKE